MAKCMQSARGDPSAAGSGRHLWAPWSLRHKPLPPPAITRAHTACMLLAVHSQPMRHNCSPVGVGITLRILSAVQASGGAIRKHCGSFTASFLSLGIGSADARAWRTLVLSSSAPPCGKGAACLRKGRHAQAFAAQDRRFMSCLRLQCVPDRSFLNHSADVAV